MKQFDESAFFVIDVETTGLSCAAGDRVCEIGAIRIDCGQITGSFGTLVNPQRTISPGAYRVNGISEEMLVDAPLFSEAARQLRPMMEGAFFVAYNAGFDYGFVAHEFSLIGDTSFGMVMIDALSLARQLLPGLGTYKQGRVAQVCGIPFPVQHRALEDAMVTAQLFTMFLSTLKAHHCTTCNHLLRNDLSSAFQATRLSIIDHALELGKELSIRYLSPLASEITNRIILPKGYIGNRSHPASITHVVAYCSDHQADMDFRIDRILDLRIIENRIT